jgi:hypothetical protein
LERSTVGQLRLLELLDGLDFAVVEGHGGERQRCSAGCIPGEFGDQKSRWT